MAFQRLFLVRHAERADNVEGGRNSYRKVASSELKYDPPLTQLGQEQASRVATYLSSRLTGLERILIVASPFLRCIQTALPFAKELQLPILLDPLLGEALVKRNFPDSRPSILMEEKNPELRKQYMSENGIPEEYISWLHYHEATRPTVKDMTFPETNDVSRRRILKEVAYIESIFRQSGTYKGVQNAATNGSSAVEHVNSAESFNTRRQSKAIGSGVQSSQQLDFTIVMFVHGFAVGSILDEYCGEIRDSIEYTAMAEIDLNSTQLEKYNDAKSSCSQWTVLQGPSTVHLNQSWDRHYKVVRTLCDSNSMCASRSALVYECQFFADDGRESCKRSRVASQLTTHILPPIFTVIDFIPSHCQALKSIPKLCTQIRNLLISKKMN